MNIERMSEIVLIINMRIFITLFFLIMYYTQHKLQFRYDWPTESKSDLLQLNTTSHNTLFFLSRFLVAYTNNKLASFRFIFVHKWFQFS